MYSMIFTDIDGTLLHDDLTIGKDTIRALEDATGEGIGIALCSGRYLDSLERIAGLLPFPVMKASVNGALIEYCGEFITDTRLDKDAYTAAAGFLTGRIDSIIAFTPYDYLIDSDDRWYEIQKEILIKDGIRMDLRSLDRVLEATGEIPCKILAKDGDSRHLASVCEELAALGLPMEIIASSPHSIEILPQGTDKGKALEAVSEHLSIPLSRMIAFGDWDNDIGMLKTAGLGICMANGSGGAKAAADWITLSNNEDGIAYALRRILG